MRGSPCVGWLAAASLGLLLLACGNSEPLAVTITAHHAFERLEDVSLVEIEVWSLETVEETRASATSPTGQTVTGLSCDSVMALEPEASDCVEEIVAWEREVELIGNPVRVSPDGTAAVENPGAGHRVRALLPPALAPLDNHGHRCAWAGDTILEGRPEAIVINMKPIC